MHNTNRMVDGDGHQTRERVVLDHVNLDMRATSITATIDINGTGRATGPAPVVHRNRALLPIVQPHNLLPRSGCMCTTHALHVRSCNNGPASLHAYNCL
jgi:hypothetical protein